MKKLLGWLCLSPLIGIWAYACYADQGFRIVFGCIGMLFLAFIGIGLVSGNL